MPNFDDLDLLAIVSQSQIGRLRYAASGTAPAAIPEQNLSDLLTYAGAESPVRLAPSYDLVCTALYQARDVLALMLGDSNSFPNRKRLATFAQATCNLTSAITAGLLDRVVAGVQRAVKEIRSYSRERADFAPAGTKLIAAIERGTASIAG
jgi:serine/threonine-protein kinase HipA